jgi:hypothetical protein
LTSGESPPDDERLPPPTGPDVARAVTEALGAQFPSVAFDVTDAGPTGGSVGEVRVVWRRASWPHPTATGDDVAPGPEEQVAAVLATFVLAGGDPSDEELDLAAMGPHARRSVEEHRVVLIGELAASRTSSARRRLEDPALWTGERWAAAIAMVCEPDATGTSEQGAYGPSADAIRRLREGLYDRLSTLIDPPGSTSSDIPRTESPT